MLVGNPNTCMMFSKKLPEVTFGAHASASGVGAGPYTATLSDIGAAAANRVVVVQMLGGSSTRPTISSCTIGGVAATAISNISAPNGGVCLFYAVVPTGTTAALSFSWNFSLAAVAEYAYWYIHDLTSTTPHDSAETAVSSGTATATGFDVPVGGVVISSGSSTLSQPSLGGTAFSGGTTDFAGYINSSAYQKAGGHINNHAGITGGTLTTVPGGTNGVLASGASWI